MNMSLAKFCVDRELFIKHNDRRKFFSIGESRLSPSTVVNLSLVDINFLKPLLARNTGGNINLSNFPFLALSNGGLFFYDSAYNNLFFDLKQSGIILFDDLYSFKNKVVF